MALQSDSKEMGKVKLYMLIGDSDSQFSIHIQGCLMPKNGQGLTKRIRYVPDITNWTKKSKI